MRHFCTYADHNYLPRVVALVDSLERGGDFILWMLALSLECEKILAALKHPRIRVIPLKVLEDADAELLATKGGRKTSEYIFTMTPCWMAYVFSVAPEIDELVYLDSDLYFFSSAQTIFNEIGSAHIGIIEHKHTKTQDQEAQYGRFNVGWVYFRRSDEGGGCLRRWRSQCIEWCFDRAEGGKFADQKYLDEWPERYRGACVISHPGANLAPWNIGRYALGGTTDQPTVDGREVVFYHFSSMCSLSPCFVRLGMEDYRVELSQRVIASRLIYKPYLKAVRNSVRKLRRAGFNGLAFNYPRQMEEGLRMRSNFSGSLLQWKKWLFEFRSERRDGRILFCAY